MAAVRISQQTEKLPSAVFFEDSACRLPGFWHIVSGEETAGRKEISMKQQPRVIRKAELNHIGYGQLCVFSQTLALYRSVCGYIGNVVLENKKKRGSLAGTRKLPAYRSLRGTLD